MDRPPWRAYGVGIRATDGRVARVHGEGALEMAWIGVALQFVRSILKSFLQIGIREFRSRDEVHRGATGANGARTSPARRAAPRFASGSAEQGRRGTSPTCRCCRLHLHVGIHRALHIPRVDAFGKLARVLRVVLAELTACRRYWIISAVARIRSAEIVFIACIVPNGFVHGLREEQRNIDDSGLDGAAIAEDLVVQHGAVGLHETLPSVLRALDVELRDEKVRVHDGLRHRG
mmetsp:Transcript_19923/g.56423  ORF Transcript_19923/g.56423 Transcript_19923/m.56423 type:complete len:233 (-) Transcript_19923:252-950(-)